MPRFIYSASGFAVAGRITSPVSREIEPQCACILPSTGGNVHFQTGPFSLIDPATGNLILSYGSAETSTQGAEGAGGTHTTVVISTVRDLNVGNVLRADEITAKMSLCCAPNDRVTIDTEGSRYVNLTIGGEPFVVVIDNPMSREASDYEEFRTKHSDLPHKYGKTTWVLGRNPNLEPDADGEPQRRQPNFGRIYFAEWQAGPGTQSLTMLRLSLGSPQKGDLTLGIAGGNGQNYP